MFAHWCRLGVCATYLSISASVQSAEIRIDPSQGDSGGAIFEGRIEVGDFDKFKKYVLDGPGAVEIYLASPGGDLVEAMRIGRLVRLLNLSTIAPSKPLTHESRDLSATRHNLKDAKANYLCVSACFFVFVAGIHRSRDASGPVVLGIHRPTLSGTGLKALSRDQIGAVNGTVGTVVKKYLSAMSVPLKYAERMLSIPPKGVFWIRNDDFDRDLAGYIPQLKNKVDSLCDKLIDQEGEKRNVPTEQAVGEQLSTDLKHRVICERRIADELARRAREAALKSRRDTAP